MRNWDLQAGPGIVIFYLSIVGPVVARVASGVRADASMVPFGLSGMLWIAAFGNFALL